MDKKKIYLVAGGTGGHVFPCIATAQALIEQGHDVTWVTDGRGLNFRKHWPNDSIFLTPVSSSNNSFKFIISLCFSFIKSFIKILICKPDVVVGFGGYPSLPMILAAQTLKKKTIVHEANATLGKANVLLGKRASHIAVSFPNAHIKAVLTGNPIRPEIAKLADQQYEFKNDRTRLLVFGGSLGAQVFNNVVPEAFGKLSQEQRDIFHVTQQIVNENTREILQEQYKELGVDATLLAFIDDVPSELAKADIVMARGGASTVAEVTCAGRATIFVPYPHHADRQQYSNAQTVVDQGGAIILDENDGEKNIVDALAKFLGDLPDIEKMAKASKALGNPKAAWTFAQLIIKTA